MRRRGFLAWAGLAGYGTWVALKPDRASRKPPKPTTTTTLAGDGYSDVYADPYR